MSSESDKLVQMSVDLLCVAGMDGYFKIISPSFERVLGYTPEEMKSRPFLDFVHPDDRPATLKEMEKLVSGAPTLRFRNRYQCKDGTYRWLEWTSNPDLKEGLLYAMARDVTNLTAREEELQRSLNFAAAIFETVRQPLLILDLKLRVKSANEAFYRTFSSFPGETEGRALFELGSGEWNILALRENLRRVTEEEAVLVDFGIAMKMPGRGRRQFQIHAQRIRPILQKGNSILIGVEDVTLQKKTERTLKGEKRELKRRIEKKEDELKSAESRLAQAQKMEAIGLLAGGVAHDFNNILSVILGYSELLLESQPVESEIRKDLEEIQSAGNRARAMTRQLLAFSRKQILQPEILNVNALVRGFERMLRRIIGEDVELVTILAEDVGNVEVDPGQLEQILLNLAVNARDAMPKGGELTLETGNVELSKDYAKAHPGSRIGPHVMISMTDTGIGMDHETRKRIFEPFFTTKEIGHGTGLGLSTVYGIVRQSGGNIWVYSEPGKGTTFKVYLPSTTAPAAGREPRPAAAGMGQHGGHVLVVEDEEGVRKLIVKVLKRAGYTVQATGDVDRAIELGKKHGHKLQLLLTDVVMPKMNGPDLVRILTGQIPNLRVVYMSGYPGGSRMHRSEIEPEMDYLEKPIAPADLLTMLAKVFKAG